MNGSLPFSLRSAPKIFMAVADALQWVMYNNGVSMVDHYLNDFVMMGLAGSQEYRCYLEKILAVCEDLGVPPAMEKLEGPSYSLSFLSIQMDTVAGRLILPSEKLFRLKSVLAERSEILLAPPAGITDRHTATCL